MIYHHCLQRIENPLPLLADFPQFVEPLAFENRHLASPVVDEEGGALRVRSWRYWYNARGIVEMENRLQAQATALLVVHPWGIDDGHGLRTPEPAGCAFFCTPEKNRLVLDHVRQVINPFLRRLREHVALVASSLRGSEDPVRRLLYASIATPPEALDPERGERLLAERLRAHAFAGRPLPDRLHLDDQTPVRSYFEQTPSPDAGDGCNGPGYWDLPMPILSALEREPRDLVFYDDEGYPRVREFLRQRGVRHLLLLGYATDMCYAATTCGYQNLSRDFNVFLVGDGSLATFPGSTTPRHATQVALANAALHQMVTQVHWVRMETPPGAARAREEAAARREQQAAGSDP